MANDLWNSLSLEPPLRSRKFGETDLVNMDAFLKLHPVELPDGRRFRSEFAALYGLRPREAAAAEARWKRQRESMTSGINRIVEIAEARRQALG